ncbi:MAG: DUF4249 family protein [Bacteroidota bacterium]
MNYKYLFIILLLFIGTSCEDTNELDMVDELMVQGYLLAGQTLESIQFKRVISFNETEALPAPTDLSPVIIAEDGTEYLLQYLGKDGLYGNTELLIEAEKSYDLEVEYNGETIKASTFVPAAPDSLTITETIIRRTQIRDFTDLQNLSIPDPIQVDWLGENGAFYFAQVKNIEANPDPINQLFIDNGFEPPVLQSEPSTNLFYLINAFQEITFFGRHEVIIYRVNPEYVNLYDSNDQGSGALNEIQTNVENGFGIFTGVNQARIEFEVIRQ